MHSSNITILKTSLILKIRFLKYLFEREAKIKYELLIFNLNQLLCDFHIGVSLCVWTKNGDT